MMHEIKAVILDCDGVMFDTQKANTAYYNYILEHFGKPPITPEQFSFAQMHTVHSSIDYLFASEPELIEKVHEFRKQCRYQNFIPFMEIDPDLILMLKTIKPTYYTAIATNRTDTMEHVLHHFKLKSYFDIVVTALDVKKAKPHPDPLLKILDHFKIKPNQALYVGDSELDEFASRQARVPFVAYKNPQLSADYHIESLQDVLSILQLS
ncbi:MAG: HAD family hydrolase [Desulfobacterales bacterium]|nr:HAD family hydrolase [Desulfobacterales bacterium]